MSDYEFEEPAYGRLKRRYGALKATAAVPASAKPAKKKRRGAMTQRQIAKTKGGVAERTQRAEFAFQPFYRAVKAIAGDAQVNFDRSWSRVGIKQLAAATENKLREVIEGAIRIMDSSKCQTLTADHMYTSAEFLGISRDSLMTDGQEAMMLETVKRGVPRGAAEGKEFREADQKALRAEYEKVKSGQNALGAVAEALTASLMRALLKKEGDRIRKKPVEVHLALINLAYNFLGATILKIKNELNAKRKTVDSFTINNILSRDTVQLGFSGFAVAQRSKSRRDKSERQKEKAETVAAVTAGVLGAPAPPPFGQPVFE
jgi:histone H3/H4